MAETSHPGANDYVMENIDGRIHVTPMGENYRTVEDALRAIVRDREDRNIYTDVWFNDQHNFVLWLEGGDTIS